jgi:hypothetical protein
MGMAGFLLFLVCIAIVGPLGLIVAGYALAVTLALLMVGGIYRTIFGVTRDMVNTDKRREVLSEAQRRRNPERDKTGDADVYGSEGDYEFFTPGRQDGPNVDLDYRGMGGG